MQTRLFKGKEFNAATLGTFVKIPNELIMLIIFCINNFDSLVFLSKTSKFFQAIVENDANFTGFNNKINLLKETSHNFNLLRKKSAPLLLPLFLTHPVTFFSQKRFEYRLNETLKKTKKLLNDKPPSPKHP